MSDQWWKRHWSLANNGMSQGATSARLHSCITRWNVVCFGTEHYQYMTFYLTRSGVSNSPLIFEVNSTKQWKCPVIFNWRKAAVSTTVKAFVSVNTTRFGRGHTEQTTVIHLLGECWLQSRKAWCIRSHPVIDRWIATARCANYPSNTAAIPLLDLPVNIDLIISYATSISLNCSLSYVIMISIIGAHIMKYCPVSLSNFTYCKTLTSFVFIQSVKCTFKTSKLINNLTHLDHRRLCIISKINLHRFKKRLSK